MYTKLAGTRHIVQKLSDQTEYLQSLIRAFAMRLMGSKRPKLSSLDSNHSGQTVRTARLICVIAGRTCHVAGFVVLTLKLSHLSAHVVNRLLHENRKSIPNVLIVQNF